MLKLPGDELVKRGTDVSHLVVRVESMAGTLDILASDRIELVQWPAGHPDGMTAADWPGKED
ncbi:hypothetical protein ACFORO_05955 [Amycolatopsis halotolerans]|uniref:Uncharacterized protein n=1 Tax=Amycolatopsis halotolerans TaxID=330083 RepID=A0ABV7QBI1_9PSEU